MVRSIEEQVAAYRAKGYGPKTVERFERGLRESIELGPLGALQKDITRIAAAITGGTPSVPLPTGRQESLLARATKLVANAANMPIEDARRARTALRRIAETTGIPLP